MKIVTLLASMLIAGNFAMAQAPAAPATPPAGEHAAADATKEVKAEGKDAKADANKDAKAVKKAAKKKK